MQGDEDCKLPKLIDTYTLDTQHFKGILDIQIQSVDQPYEKEPGYDYPYKVEVAALSCKHKSIVFTLYIFQFMTFIMFRHPYIYIIN